MIKPKCSSDDGCNEESSALGLCAKHYRKKRYYARKDGTWKAPKCPEHPDRPVLAKGVCASCYGTNRMAEKRAEVRNQPRDCECGCGVSLVGRAPNAKYATIRCKERVLGKRKAQQPGYAERQAKRYQARAEDVRIRYLKWAYDLDAEEYDEMLERQGGGCAVCGLKPERTDSRSLHVDHCHTTKVVRGILCNNCNSGIGQFKDDVARLRAAADYLEAFQRQLEARGVTVADHDSEPGELQPVDG